MSSTTSAGLMTAAEFERLPDPPNGGRQELRHGEVIELPPPKPIHGEIQYRLLTALNALGAPRWTVRSEVPFRPAAEYEVWQADVAVIDSEKWQEAVQSNVYPEGAPAIVIEVLSPSIIVSDLYDRERTCLESGCREFWSVDPETRQIRVSTPDRLTRTYRKGEQIAVGLLGGSLAVDDIL